MNMESCSKYGTSTNTLQDWKLYRQFQKTLESLSALDVDSDSVQNGDQKSSPDLFSDRFHEILEVTNIEDEGEQVWYAINLCACLLYGSMGIF